MNQVTIFALGLLVVECVTAFGPAKKPHVMFILVDDLGHAELGYNREVPTQEVIAKKQIYIYISRGRYPRVVLSEGAK